MSNGFDDRRRVPIGAAYASKFRFRESSELRWIDTPGPGYSKRKASEIIRNRYRGAVKPVRKTLAKLKKSERFQDWVAGLRASGKQDWWILLFLVNAVLNYRMNLRQTERDLSRLRERMRDVLVEEEADDAPPFPEELLYERFTKMQDGTVIAATAKTWGLVIRRHTPDFASLERVMAIRYGQSSDDVEHEELFAA
jgi:hypothetical protein